MFRRRFSGQPSVSCPAMRRQCLFVYAIVVIASCGRAGAAEAPPDGYRVGVNGAYLPNLKQETLRRWVRETGAAMPRVGIRMDLFQKGMPDHGDALVNDCVRAGGSPIVMLFNESWDVTRSDGKKDSGCRPPKGLWEPVFDNGSDEGAPGAKANPKNEWAAFVFAIAERYNGDHVADAPGSRVVTYFSIWNEPDWVPWPNRPKKDDKGMRNWSGQGAADLARLAFVSHRAIRRAHASAKVGMQLCFNETLGYLLDDAKHPLAKNCDFIDFHAYGGKGSDDNCFRNDGIVPVARQMRGEFEKRGLRPPPLVCTETGVGGGPPGSVRGRTQAAAVIKANVVAASEGLLSACWYALVDPSWENMGLIADASKLPPDGAGAEMRDAMTAIGTASLLLDGAVRVEEVEAPDDAHAYRFRDGKGREMVVAWADDANGNGATAMLHLPLAAGTWERLEWDYVKSQKPARTVVAMKGQKTRLDVTTTPVFLRLTPP